jgi:hypothetical protein
MDPLRGVHVTRSTNTTSELWRKQRHPVMCLVRPHTLSGLMFGVAFALCALNMRLI